MRFLLIIFFILSFGFGENIDNLKDVTLQLQWKSTFEFAGFYVAKERGYYKDIGLNVHIKEWEPNMDVVDKIIKQKADYGVLRPSSLIDISKGKELIYLLAVYQSNPLVLLADESSNIKTIKDIKNKRVMATKEHLKDAAIVSLFISQDMKISDIKTVKYSFDVKNLLNKKADLMVAYLSNEPFVLEELGGNPIIFNSKDYGFDFYNDFLTTSKEYLKNNTDEVEKFKQATIKGYEYAFSHMDEVIDFIYNKHNSLNKSKKALTYEANELKKLAFYKTDKIGSISKERLEKAYYIYRLLGLINHDINVENIIHKEILTDIKLSGEEKIYLQNKDFIKVCADPDWLPFDKLTKDGEFIGIGADYMKLIEKFLSIKTKRIKTTSWSETLKLAKEGKCDIVTSIVEIPKRKKYFNFTAPYANFALVAATKTEVPFINNIEDLKGKKVGAIKDFAFVDIVKQKFPSIKIYYIKSLDEGLDRVNSGELFAIIDTLPSIVHALQLNQSGDIKISGKIYDDWELRMAVKKDDKVLLDIVQKAIKNISVEQKQKIFNQWISLKFKNKPDYDLIQKIVSISLVLLIIMFFWNRKINSINKLLKTAQKEIEEKNKKLDLLATTDKLTGIYNRLKLDRILNQEIERARRYKGMFGVCILDIDFFKKINDTYGHQAGDITLQELSKLLNSSIRKSDFLGRWGGEEFLIICIEIGEDSLFSMIDKIRNSIKKYHFSHIENLTVSFGITTYKDNDTLESLIKRADDALYRAKQMGRDKVVRG